MGLRLLTLLLLLGCNRGGSTTAACTVDSDCAPARGTAEPKSCERVSSKPDSVTPFDRGFACGCVSSTCALVAGPALKPQLEDAVLRYVAGRWPECGKKGNLKSIDVRAATPRGATVFMVCNCGMDCGYRCDLEAVVGADGGWEIEPRDYECAVN